ncbi:MAG TPA: ATP-dependent DNA ligase [Terriglobales bacterium]
MEQFAQLCEAVAATTKKMEKLRLISEYLGAQDVETAAIAAAFLSGRPFPATEETTLNVGGSLIWRAIGNIADISGDAVGRAYRKTGDTGAAAEILLSENERSGAALTVPDVEAAYRAIAAARGTDAKERALEDLLRRATPLEAKYILKIITSELRIGSKEALVEEALAKAYGEDLAAVRRANMLLGDIGETLRLAQQHTLHTAKMRLFHPLGFMLASPADSAQEAFEYFSEAAVEDKYDGIRAQAHCSDGTVKLFSRTLDEISESFPEVVAALASMPEDVILDGEILGWNANAPADDPVAEAEKDYGSVSRFHSHLRGRALPFGAIQKRLGRKKVSPALIEQYPVAYVVFDVIYADAALAIERPLSERIELLDKVFEEFSKTPAKDPTVGPQSELFGARHVARILRAPVTRASSSEELDEIFDAARARGNEGLMIKDLSSPYLPGRRGKSWLKLKRELATIDVVVTGTEWGNGRKARWLSDYTFAVRDTATDRLVNVGKAYSGVTDVEIEQLTAHFKETILVDYGHFRTVQPDTVLEVAFNNIMISDRHESGFALRFPRILRIRTDKGVHDIDTLDRVREIYDSETAAGRAAGRKSAA